MRIIGMTWITQTHDKISAPDGLWGQVFVDNVTISERVWGASFRVSAEVKAGMVVKQKISKILTVRRNGQHNVTLIPNAYYGNKNGLAAGDKVEISCLPLPMRTYDVFVPVTK